MPHGRATEETGDRPGMRPCPRILDEPLRFLGLDAEDGAVGLTLFTLLHLLGASFWGLVVGAAASGLLLALKRGQPPGVVRHRLWCLGVPFRPLPPSPTVTGARRSPW
jgi:type IV conjugative transfer system protein TraL